MSRPDDIPEDVWEAARLASDAVLIAAGSGLRYYSFQSTVAAIITASARALMAADASATARAIAACEAQKAGFLSPEYAYNQPLGSMLERFAVDECIAAIGKGGE